MRVGTGDEFSAARQLVEIHLQFHRELIKFANGQIGPFLVDWIVLRIGEVIFGQDVDEIDVFVLVYGIVGPARGMEGGMAGGRGGDSSYG